MANTELDAVLEQVCPTPKVETIGGKEFEFWPITLEEHVKIKKHCGRDMTQEVFKGGGKFQPDSELILEALYFSMKRSKSPLVKELTREKTSDLLQALGGFGAESIMRLFMFALNGEQKEKAEGDGAGNPTSPESTGE